MSSGTGDINWNHVSHVTNSRYRRIVIDELYGRPAKPTDSETSVDEDLSHVSRAIQELRSKGLVELLVSDDKRKGRIYGLTSQGRSVADYLSESGR